MRIRIKNEELEFPWSLDYYRFNKLHNVGIDYATQTLDAVDMHDNYSYVTILYFKKYGIVMDNRFNSYDIIQDDDGFLIEIHPKKM